MHSAIAVYATTENILFFILDLLIEAVRGIEPAVGKSGKYIADIVTRRYLSRGMCRSRDSRTLSRMRWRELCGGDAGPDPAATTIRNISVEQLFY